MRLAIAITIVLVLWQLMSCEQAVGYGGEVTNVKTLWWLRTGIASVLIYGICKHHRSN